jgi:homospermidine synthase
MLAFFVKLGIMVSLSLCATREFVTEGNLETYAKLARQLGTHFIRILEPRQVGCFSDR